jgi:diguanylate cyclase (GGDEF)-like protein/PAS domain S-box-containing protein
LAMGSRFAGLVVLTSCYGVALTAWPAVPASNIYREAILDGVLWLSYLGILAILTCLFIRHRGKSLSINPWLSLALFVIACGFMHFTGVITLWQPEITLVAAIASISMAVALPFLAGKFGIVLRDADTSRKNQHRFLAFASCTNDSFFILESVRNVAEAIIDFRISWVNKNAGDLLSSTRDALLGKSLSEGLPINLPDDLFERYKQVVESGEAFVEEMPLGQGIDATWLRIRGVRLEDGVAVSIADVSERKRAELLAAKTRASMRSMIECAPVAIIASDLDGVVTEFNPAAERMFWYARDEIIGKAKPDILHVTEEMVERSRMLTEELGVEIPLASVFTAKPVRGLPEEAEWTYVRKDGFRFTGHLTLNPLLDERGARTGFVGFIHDVAQRKRLKGRMSHLANHDPLTGLPGRGLLRDRLGVLLRRARRNRSSFAVLMLDLDRFKNVNHTGGHHVGDELLVKVAECLRATMRASDTVARMGGDEFVLLLDDLPAERNAQIVATKLLDTLSQPIWQSGQLHWISASIGICIYPEGGQDSEALLRHANIALHRAKAQDHQKFSVFYPKVVNKREMYHAVFEGRLQGVEARRHSPGSEGT